MLKMKDKKLKSMKYLWIHQKYSESQSPNDTLLAINGLNGKHMVNYKTINLNLIPVGHVTKVWKGQPRPTFCKK